MGLPRSSGGTAVVKEVRNIVQDNAICGGDPILEGTRIRVSDVVAQVEYQERSPEDVVSSFPALSVSDVYAAFTLLRAPRPNPQGDPGAGGTSELNR
jgi:uncharacterized protein (DUF433 family)